MFLNRLPKGFAFKKITKQEKQVALLYEWEIQQNTQPLLHQAHNTTPPLCVGVPTGHPSIHKATCVLGQRLLDLKKSHESHKKVPRRECAQALVLVKEGSWRLLLACFAPGHSARWTGGEVSRVHICPYIIP